MSNDTWDTCITIASVIGEAAVVYTMLRKSMWQKLPVFLCYIIWALVSDGIALYFQVHKNPDFYLAFYRVMMSVDALLQFTVLIELISSVLKPVRHQLPKGSLVVLIVLLAIIGLITWPIASIAMPANLTIASQTIFRLAAIFAVLRIVLFLVMAGFSQLLSISWRDRELQVATGLGFYSIVSLIVMLFSSHQPGDRIHPFTVAASIGYLCTLVYWVLSFSAKEYERKEFSPQMQQFLVYMGGTTKAGSLALSKIPPDHSRKRDK